MLKKLISKGDRWGIWPFTTVMGTHRRRTIRGRIESGAFDPDPAQPCYRMAYARPAAGEAIPRVFHYTLKDAALPAFFVECKQTIERYHLPPVWQHRMWNDDEIIRLVDEHFPQYSAKFRLLSRMIMKVDTFRYMLLHTHGGVYSVLDVVAYRPLDALLADCRLLLPAERDEPDVNHSSLNISWPACRAMCSGSTF